MLRYLLLRSFILISKNCWNSSIFLLSFLVLLITMLRAESRFFKITFITEIDSVRLRLVLLRVWIIILCYLRRIKNQYKPTKPLFYSTLLILLIFLFFSFMFNNFLLFYIRFECSLIPVLFLILGWGYQPERRTAGLYIIFYTIFASLPLLILILNKNQYERLFIYIITTLKFERAINIFLIRAFLVKFPIYVVHLWLPKAHVEAPVAGSIILAGVLLKLGGYGIIRFIPLRENFDLIKTSIIWLSVWGGLLVRLTCLTQIDIKALVAYSSVVHIRTCIAALFTINEFGLKATVIIIIAHGLCSSGLFYIVGLMYDRTGSRRLTINKGFINLIPSIRIWWFLLLAANIAAPPTINLLRETILISSLISWTNTLLFPIFILTFARGAYRIYLFSLRQHGKFIFIKQSFHRGGFIEFLVVFLHWLPLNLIILGSFFIVCFFSL